VRAPEGCHEAATPERVPGPPDGPRSRVVFLAVVAGLSLVLVGSSVIAFLGLGPRPRVNLEDGATIFYNEACGDCATYLNGELVPTLERFSLPRIVVKDYVNDRSARAELTALNDAIGIPFELQSHLATFVAGSALTVFEGHVPAVLMDEALGLPSSDRPPRLLLYQDRMDAVESYRAWAFEGSPQTYPATVPLDAYLAWHADQVGAGGILSPSAPTLLLVVTAGLLDGLNPCAFAVLVFFVSFLYAIRAPRAEVLRLGGVYAYAVFLAYFLIGLGLLTALVLSADPHGIAKVAAVGVIALGAWTLLGVVAPRLPSLSSLSHASWPRIRRRILGGSVPSAAAAGVLVGLCTFPCSGGIYVAILGLLGAQASFLEGLAYLYLYNGMYILPLVVVLAVVSSRGVALAATRWERAHTGTLRVLLAAVMVAMGAILLAVSW
jgi:cytochrome c biogenesis protein CcdA